MHFLTCIFFVSSMVEKLTRNRVIVELITEKEGYNLAYQKSMRILVAVKILDEKIVSDFMLCPNSEETALNNMTL